MTIYGVDVYSDSGVNQTWKIQEFLLFFKFNFSKYLVKYGFPLCFFKKKGIFFVLSV